MSSELLINVTPQESRIALLENGILQEVMVERSDNKDIVGNIYHGEVCRVLPGMEAAFIDIGLEKAAFLHASDLRMPSNMQLDVDDSLESPKTPAITEILHVGKSVIVQVIKEPMGTKGARLTMQVTLPSRYLVLMPDNNNVGISSKIEDEDERERLKNVITEAKEDLTAEPSSKSKFSNKSKPSSKSKSSKSKNTHTRIDKPAPDYGYIARTAAEGVDLESIHSDMKFLNRLWETIKTSNAKKSHLVYSELPLSQRTLRDLASQPLEEIRVDSRSEVKVLKDFCKRFTIDLVSKIKHYKGDRPLFDIHGVEEEIRKSLKRKVQLKSGGYLIIDQTEAMTTIDVNTGGFVGYSNLEETIFKTNLEAAQAIARQLRIRNLGGIIIIDFIDMREEQHKSQMMSALSKALETDYAKTFVSDVSQLGLVEMTRKRTRESLEHVLCESCPTCEGRGYVKSATTVCYEIFREILREARQFEANELLVLASVDVTDLLLDEESDSLAELQEFIGVPIRFQAEALYNQEQFDVVIL